MVKRVYITYGRAVSLKVVAETISTVLERNGIIGTVTDQFYPSLVGKGGFNGVLFVYPADPVYALEKASYYILVKPRFGEKTQWYTTIEGEPIKQLIDKPIWKYIDFIANSKYTYMKLAKAGLNVKTIVPHAVDFEEVERAKKLSEAMRKRIVKEFGNKITFAVISSTHFRKNLNALVHAVEGLPKEVRDKTVFFVVSEKPFLDKIRSGETPLNFYVVGEMGKQNHTEILAFLGSVNYYITTTQSEGFGLPVLEAMAMGTPPLHGWFPPLTEFTTKECSITWDYTHVEKQPGKGGLLFELHKFDTKEVAKAIMKAVHIKESEPEKYEKMREACIRQAKKYDADKIYKYFVEIFR